MSKVLLMLTRWYWLISPSIVVGIEIKQFISNNGLKGKKLTVKQFIQSSNFPFVAWQKSNQWRGGGSKNWIDTVKPWLFGLVGTRWNSLDNQVSG